jgi:hypothetical protein
LVDVGTYVTITDRPSIQYDGFRRDPCGLVLESHATPVCAFLPFPRATPLASRATGPFRAIRAEGVGSRSSTPNRESDIATALTMDDLDRSPVLRTRHRSVTREAPNL